jgi:CRP-like cAMP-binding protein
MPVGRTGGLKGGQAVCPPGHRGASSALVRPAVKAAARLQASVRYHTVCGATSSMVVVMMSELLNQLPPEGHNAMLDALVAGARTDFENHVSMVELEADQLVTAEENRADGLLFPISGLMCRLVTMPEGHSVKVSLIGREGVAGIAALVDKSRAVFRTVVQLPGRALFLPRREAGRLLEVPWVARILARYVLLLLRESSLTAACNRSHPTNSRLARWLLLIGDRTGRPAFPLTHESLSAMLGVRRESVTVSANELRTAGAIDYRRASVMIADRSELRKHACSCYRVITDGYMDFLKSGLAGPS